MFVQPTNGDTGEHWELHEIKQNLSDPDNEEGEEFLSICSCSSCDRINCDDCVFLNNDRMYTHIDNLEVTKKLNALEL